MEYIDNFWREERGAKRRSKSVLHLDYCQNFRIKIWCPHIWSAYLMSAYLIRIFDPHIWCPHIWSWREEWSDARLKGIPLYLNTILDTGDTPIFFRFFSIYLEFFQKIFYTPRFFFEFLSKNLKFRKFFGYPQKNFLTPKKFFGYPEKIFGPPKNFFGYSQKNIWGEKFLGTPRNFSV